ncbi:YgzB family protein [Alteribacillus sp. JSM 102045]|uniref:YgzB family protein n=1 Tax=Alteribacillus sp. JSM 102045 TaxID=1562101 RepID=UPI0035C06C99
MTAKATNKINRIRTFALSLVFIGIFVMYIGIFFRSSPIIMTTTMLLGFIFVLSSSAVYFWIGMISTNTVKVECPNCGKVTKILGRVDACMYCDEPLTLDKELEGEEFNPKYNKKARNN